MGKDRQRFEIRNRFARDRLQSATPKVKIFNIFIYMMSMVTKFTPHIKGAFMIVLQQLFAKKVNVILFVDFLFVTLTNNLPFMINSLTLIRHNALKIPIITGGPT